MRIPSIDLQTEPLHDKCKRIIQMMPMDLYPDAACDVVGAIKAERHRWLALLDYAELHFNNGREMLVWLRDVGENGSRV